MHEMRLQLTNTLGDLSPYFVLVFGLESQDMVCAFHCDFCVCVRVKEWQLLATNRANINVCGECFIFYHTYNLMQLS